MKKTKIIIPALGILLLSTAASVTGTVAWFSMNDTVSASGMQIKAKAEQGIVIANEDAAVWSASATAKYNTPIEVLPTSTADFVTWYHAQSTNAGDAQKEQTGENAYETLSLKLDKGVGFVDADADNAYNADAEDDEDAYYLLNKFYIKASSAETITNTNLKLQKVAITVGNNSAELDKAFRVGILVSDGKTSGVSKQYIFAPTDADTAIKVANTTSVTTLIPGPEGVVASANQPTGILTIPNNEATPGSASNPAIEVKVFLWVEGEDLHCMSDNIKANLDNLSASLTFTLA